MNVSTNQILAGLGGLVIVVTILAVVKKTDFFEEEGSATLLSEAKGESVLVPEFEFDEKSAGKSLTEMTEEALEEDDKKDGGNPFDDIANEDFFSTDLVEDDRRAKAERELKKLRGEEVVEPPKKKKQKVKRRKPSKSKPEPIAAEPKVQPTVKTYGFRSVTATSSSDEAEIALTGSKYTSAVIHNEQTIVNGQSVRMRLKEDMIIDGIKVPENSVIYGTASFGKNRLQIQIRSVETGGRLLSVQKDVYGQDGLEGIPYGEIPGADQVVDRQKRDQLGRLGRRSDLANIASESAQVLTRRKKKITLKDEFKLILK